MGSVYLADEARDPFWAYVLMWAVVAAVLYFAPTKA